MNESHIWEVYNRHSYAEGWAFMMTPEASLKTASTVLVGLNPGGTGREGCWDHAPGNAYFMQKWAKNDTVDSAIQIQVKAIHEVLGVPQDDIFAAQFIPFRSRDLASLANKKEAQVLAMDLWSWVAGQSPAKLYLCMGEKAGGSIAHILGAKWTEDFPTGWGATQFRRRVADDGRVVVQMPHPSRYQLYSQSDPAKLALAKRNLAIAARRAGEPHSN